MKLPRRTIPIAIVLLVVGGLGVGVWWRLAGDGAGDAQAESANGGEAPDVSATSTFSTDIAIPVEGREVVQGPLIISVNAAAQAAAARQTTLLAQVEGRVQSVAVRANDRVRAGQLLIQLDTAEYALEVDAARAGLAQAQAQFRELTLFDDEIADAEVRAERARVARAKSGLDAAEVRLRQAQLRLERTRVTAPFTGRAASVRVVVGQTVRTGDEVLTVVDLDPIEVEVQVLESEIGYLAPGRRATVTFAAFPGEPFTGRIATVNPMVDRETRTATVVVELPNREGRILPGMYARVALEARRFEDRILVPRASILERDRRTMLFVFEDGLAKWRYVTTGRMNDSLVEVVEHPETQMVEPGEIVLTDGHYTLIHDARVRIVENVAEEGGRPQ